MSLEFAYGAIDHSRDIDRFLSEMYGASKLEKPGDKRICAVHFRGDAPASSCATSFWEFTLFMRSISADARIVPSGFRSSCAKPAVN